MLKQFQDRSEFWSVHHKVGCQGDSIARPFEQLPCYPSPFLGRRVLEIGPGEGHQFDHLSKLASEYAVADISPAVLQNARYAHVRRYKVTDFQSDSFDERFDVVCFWYVLHHVLLSESEAFVEFVLRHLEPEGHVVFNAPHANPAAQFAFGDGNGLQTTRWTTAAVLDLLKRHSLRVITTQDLAPNCLMVHAIKPASNEVCDRVRCASCAST